MDKDLKRIKEELQQAEQNFNYAGQEYLDAAIHELKAVEEKFRAILREKKKERRERSD